MRACFFGCLQLVVRIFLRPGRIVVQSTFIRVFCAIPSFSLRSKVIGFDRIEDIWMSDVQCALSV